MFMVPKTSERPEAMMTMSIPWFKPLRNCIKSAEKSMPTPYPLTLVRYSPLRVSTLIFSPSSINGGT
jgi:hypothetical protein